MDEAEHTLDLKGLKCPLPALRTAKFLKTLPAGATVCVTCTDALAVIDIPNLLNETGDELVSRSDEAGVLRFLIRKR